MLIHSIRQGGESSPLSPPNAMLLGITSYGIWLAPPEFSGPMGRCPMKPNTPLGPDQVNVLLLCSSEISGLPLLNESPFHVKLAILVPFAVLCEATAAGQTNNYIYARGTLFRSPSVGLVHSLPANHQPRYHFISHVR
jgi:hypothetical protein